MKQKPEELEKLVGIDKVNTFYNIVNEITKLYDIEYEIDGIKERGLFSLILISNANHIAGFNNIYKNVKLDDDKFEIIFCNISRRKDLVRSLIMLVRNDITKIPGIYSYTGKNIKIKFYDKPKNNWTIDGEKYKNISKTYEIKIEKNMEKIKWNGIARIF